jgi:ubiquinone/menaquinone biosynthesis C-methylase UbiE
VKLQLRTQRLLLGLRGLALLRGWPFESTEEADAHIVAIEELIGHEPTDPGIVEIDDPGLRGAYASWSETYDTIPNALIDTEEPVLRSFLANVERGRAIDVACGTGRLAGILAEAGHDVVAVDASPEMLLRARVKELPAKLLLGDVRRLPVRSESMDLAVCALALTHVEDLSLPLAEIARVVRPGGHVILSDVHPVAVATGAQAFFKMSDGSRGVARNHVHWPSSYVDAFSASGLVVERMSEPLVDERFGADVSVPEVRLAIGVSLTGLPLVLIWLLRKT